MAIFWSVVAAFVVMCLFVPAFWNLGGNEIVPTFLNKRIERVTIKENAKVKIEELKLEAAREQRLAIEAEVARFDRRSLPSGSGS